MLRSHELPLNYLNLSRYINDYEYCLPMFWKYPEYRQHYIQARNEGRFIILDNGLFEGKVEEKSYLLDIYNIINPDILIAPDVWDDAEETYKKYEEWKNYIDYKKLMIVIQGKNSNDVYKLFKKINNPEICVNIGFNYLGNFYKEYTTTGDLITGRINFIDLLSSSFNENIHYHLLGLNNINELKEYKKHKKYIKTIDTSDPIIRAFTNEDYNISLSKPQTKLKDIFEYEYKHNIHLKIQENINIFKNI